MFAAFPNHKLYYSNYKLYYSLPCEGIGVSDPISAIAGPSHALALEVSTDWCPRGQWPCTHPANPAGKMNAGTGSIDHSSVAPCFRPMVPKTTKPPNSWPAAQGQRVPRSSDGFHGNGPTSMWPGNVIRKHIMDDALGVQRHIS
jgi:hypothetical protein